MSEEIGCYVLHGHSEHAASLPLPFSTKITLDQSWEKIQKGVRLCTLEGEADRMEVNKAETKTVLAYFYKRHGKISLPISVLPSGGSLLIFWLRDLPGGWARGWDGGEEVPQGRGKKVRSTEHREKILEFLFKFIMI